MSGAADRASTDQLARWAAEAQDAARQRHTLRIQKIDLGGEAQHNDGQRPDHPHRVVEDLGFGAFRFWIHEVAHTEVRDLLRLSQRLLNDLHQWFTHGRKSSSTT